ncbi:MAG TPA: hypothetical protein VMH88_08875 [Gemmatimonadales bacterium]|nr:hypothetical protein [Gemmatimonadales bacterium]
MRTRHWTGATVVIAALIGVGCSDAGTSASTDQTMVSAAFQDQIGAMGDMDFGASGAVATATLAGSPSAILADTAIVPGFWGRERVVPGGPRPILTKDIVVQGDTAWVTRGAQYQGIFLTDTSDDGVFNPTSKPLADGAAQKAVLVRRSGERHGWKLVSLSPVDWTTTAEDRRTVAIQQVQVYRNGALKLQIDNPDSLFDVDTSCPHFHVGDTVTVVAQVGNTTGGDFTPATFVFLHVRHADPNDVDWRRVKMNDQGDGTWKRTFIVRHSGRDRLIVDALDAATIVLGTPDNYRANEWGIPYVIE